MLVLTASAHFTEMRHDLVRMIPPIFPAPMLIVYITGVLELAGAVGLLLPKFRRVAGVCLAALFAVMFVANVHAGQTGAGVGGAAVTAAESHLQATMGAIWDKVRHELPTAEDRAALYSAGLHAATVGRAAVAAMHITAGTTALYVDCPLERSIRDLQTVERHIAAQPLWLEDSGRVLLGHEPINPLFMI